MKNILGLKDLDLRDARVLMRVDFNVPLNDSGEITDDTRIEAALPSIQYILDHKASLILMSHLGRPKGEFDPKYSLKPLAKALSSRLGVDVKMASDCIGKEVEEMAHSLKPGDVLLLENLRFHEAEKKPEKDPEFAKKLASLGTLYVNDAFGTSHRAHSSIVGVAECFPGKAAAGFLLKKEIEYLRDTLTKPKRPFCAIIGGAKISTKIDVIKALIEKVDALLIGGGMAYTFLKAQGLSIGNSIFEEEYLDTANDILGRCIEKQVHFLLPHDLIVADAIREDADILTVDAKEIPDGYEGVDIGPIAIEEFTEELQKAKTIFWNGPLGVYEVSLFSNGTKAIAEALADTSGIKIVGGGDSVSALNAIGAAKKMTHVSTGGGASLEFIEKGTLPGIEVLTLRT
ncbi:MAG: phosphoglycerate kinase [Chlamydiales bacterium]